MVRRGMDRGKRILLFVLLFETRHLMFNASLSLKKIFDSHICTFNVC
jgi:hypothetical protein